MYLGIDLGTSNSAIAGLSDGRVRIFKTPEGTDTMPSVIYRDRRGNHAVGVRAFNQLMVSPDNAVEGFKRLMGTDTPLRFASTSEAITPEQAATEVLRALVGNALMESGSTTITGAVVTIPAAFNQVQSEATLAAAREAGLERVALLQEPVAAALAAMAGARDRSGVFLVYDFGGGTFDAALVHSVDGDVTVLAHEGANMLGGRDLDRGITDALVLPWLRQTFNLPENLALDRKYTRLFRIARRSAEIAKITLSIREETSVSASDEEVRLDDLDGAPIYLDVPLTRKQLEERASEAVERSIACCRDMLAHEGFRHEDVARVVLIGGPTRMPFLSRRVQDGLGIEVEDTNRVDPMTAVAAGAAIYCEGRNWSSTGSTAKPMRRTENNGNAVAVAYEFEARTSASHAQLVIRQTGGPAGAEVLVDSLLGWSSGRRKLLEPVILNLPLSKEPGANRFRATVFGADGVPVADASREIVVDHLLATTSGVPATHTIAVKIRGDNDQDVLNAIVNKGTVLPASGVVPSRLANTMRAGDPTTMRVELFQIDDEEVLDPALNLSVGEFQVRASDLPQGVTLRRGDKVIVHWAMSEGQEITTEVEIPDVEQRFDRRNFYNWRIARDNLAGEAGGRLVATHLDLAERDLSNAEDVVPPAHASSLPGFRRDLNDHATIARGTLDPDARRKAVEEVRKLRQKIAVICLQPDARRHLLRRRLERQEFFHERDIRSGATRDQVAHVNTLLHSAEGQIESGGQRGLDLASEQIDELARLYWHYGLFQHAFCANQFERERDNRHLASDPAAFDRLMAEGEKALAARDAVALRNTLVNLWCGQVRLGKGVEAGERASLMRA